MVSRFFKCDPDRLKLLLADQLAEEGQRELAEHLETCQACRQRLEMLAADEKWWSEARASLRGQPAAASPAAAAGGQGGAADRVATDAGQCDTAEIPLEFLAPTDQPGKLGRLGSYEIEAIVGSGGMGVVLKGFDPQLSRHVAIKVLLPLLATSAAARRRFAREARAAAAIVHEHVVPIHAVDFAGDLPYLVMPLIVGRSLQQRIDQEGPLGVKEILRIGMQTAAGLGAAHAQGLVHRDVKPANILLENGVERVMITDFGLARAMDDASCTRSGVVAGTPQYMAPEQAEGHTVDHRADLFGLGSVLYAMCTGRPPFRAETTMAVLRRICEGQPRPIREIYPEIPDWLVAIIAKLHQKDPAERFQSAAEVADLLGRSLAHVQQPLAVPLPRGLRPHLWRRITLGLRRHAGAVGLSALLLAAGFAALETSGLTHVTARFVESLRGSSPAQDSTQGAAPAVPAAPAAPAAENLATSGKAEDTESSGQEPDMHQFRLDDAFQGEITAIGQALRAMEKDGSGQHGETSAGRRATLLAELRARLADLEDDLDRRERYWELSADPLPAALEEVRGRLGILEREMGPDHATAPPNPLGEVGARLHRLQQELDTSWP